MGVEVRSPVVSAYDIGTAEGMNERGLVVNELALVESDYGTPPEGAKVISLSTWPQYVLDNFATVAETVADLQKENFRVQTMVLGTGRAANMHLVISDASSDSAVFEYVQGKLVIHHGKHYRVMTNSPTYDKQLAIMEYWKEAGGLSKSLAPATFWVRFDELDLRPGAPVRKLELAGGRTYSGNAARQFVDAEPFTFQDLSDVAPAR